LSAAPLLNLRIKLVRAEYCVTSCDLGVFVDEAAEPVTSQNPDTCARGGRTLASGGRVLVQRPVRPMGVATRLMADVLAGDQQQVPFAGDQRWAWIALWLRYVINPARWITANNRPIETSGRRCGKSQSADISSQPHQNGRSISPACANTHAGSHVQPRQRVHTAALGERYERR
jgi:hypothetical protein